MELKLVLLRFVWWPVYLLIVPYGIETTVPFVPKNHPPTFNRTLWNWNTTIGNSLHLRLAFNRTLWNWNKVFISSSRSFIILLIVPYGIETPNSNVRVVVVNAAFNRTLWNWNSYNIMTVPEYRTFNRTLWNWNSSIPFRNFCK